MKNTDLQKHPVHQDRQFPRALDLLLEPELLEWLEQLEREGPIAFDTSLPRTAAARCRESGWTQVRVVQPEGRVMHELTDRGGDALRIHRRAQQLLRPGESMS